MLESTTNRQDYTGNGSTSTHYVIPFRYDAESWIHLSADGGETELTQGIHFILGGDGRTTAGWFTTPTAYGAGVTLTVWRTAPASQTLGLESNEPLPAPLVEAALDRMTMAIQDQTQASNPGGGFPVLTGAANPNTAGVAAAGIAQWYRQGASSPYVWWKWDGTVWVQDASGGGSSFPPLQLSAPPVNGTTAAQELGQEAQVIVGGELTRLFVAIQVSPSIWQEVPKGTTVIVISQTDYDALPSPDPSVIYIIPGIESEPAAVNWLSAYAVMYDRVQILSTTQKTRSRANIDAASASALTAESLLSRAVESSLQSQIDAFEAALANGDDYLEASLADLPVTANATSPPRPEFASVYNDASSDDDNGRYFREFGETSWTKVPGDLTGRVSSVELQATETDERTEGAHRSIPGEQTKEAIITDKNGVVLYGFDYLTNLPFGAGITNQIFYSIESDAFGFLVVDPDGVVLYNPQSSDGGGSLGPLPASANIAAVEGIIHYGQSWKVGAQGTPVINTAQVSRHLGPATHLNAPIASPSDVVPLQEHELGDTRGETGIVAMVNRLDAEWEQYSGTKPTYLCFSSALGSATYSQLKKDTAQWAILVGSLTQAKAYCTAQGLAFKCRSVFWFQGNATAANLQELQTDLNTMVKGITGQSEDVHLFNTQVSYGAANPATITLPTVANDQVLADGTNGGKIHLIAPTYDLPAVWPEQIHLQSFGYATHGVREAEAFISQFIGSGQKAGIPSLAAAAVNYVLINIATSHGPLVFDLDAFGKVTDFGFRVINGDGTNIPITRVDIMTNKVQLAWTTPASGAVKIRYGLDYANPRPDAMTAAGCGNLRLRGGAPLEMGGKRIVTGPFLPSFQINTTI